MTSHITAVASEVHLSMQRLFDN